MAKPELTIVVSNPSPEPHHSEPPPQQVEMPFAVVNGEPVTELPRDLYIPPQALEVFLEAFEGPLDLLLYLIRRQNLDILDIPLAEITKQYMRYIELMADLQLELAGEYLVMAATLAEIKSRMLLPRPKTTADGVEEDPRAELVRRLQEYERFKRAAEDIDTLPRLERDNWAASAELKDRQVSRVLPQITLQEMLVAFQEVVVRAEMFAHHHIQRERLSVRQRMSDILSSLERASFVEFIRLFRPEEGRMGVTVTFMAILELVREGLIDLVQAEPYAPLHVRAATQARRLRVVADNGEPRPSEEPSAEPTGELSAEPANELNDELSDELDDELDGELGGELDGEPSDELSDELSDQPGGEPNDELTAEPSNELSAKPSNEPSAKPSNELSAKPSNELSAEPGDELSGEPSNELSAKPGDELSAKPAGEAASAESTPGTGSGEEDETI